MVSQPSSPTRDLPEPMSPPDCDLRGYEYMPLFGQKLFGSSFYTLALTNPRAGLAAQKLWWEAWQQRPAGSLPADDATLCRLADFGTDIKGWAKAKDVALHGFVLCNDGRLYHPLLSEEAILAHRRRMRDRQRQANYRATKGTGSGGHDADVTRDKTQTRRGRDERQDGDVQGERTGDKIRGKKPPFGPPLGRGGIKTLGQEHREGIERLEAELAATTH